MGRRTIKVVFVGEENPGRRSGETLKSYAEIVENAINALKGDNYWYDTNPGSAMVALLEAQSERKK